MLVVIAKQIIIIPAPYHGQRVENIPLFVAMIYFIFIFVQMKVQKRNLPVLLDRLFYRVDIVNDTRIAYPFLRVQEDDVVRIGMPIYPYRGIQFANDGLLSRLREFGRFHHIRKHCDLCRIEELMLRIIVPRLLRVRTYLVSILVQ